ncbi:thioesterase family protein [Treponema sp. OttesenSCG-928-L16]|nr:thioesterase family protein [Treponema sp. OttesenSCG-928-L16]
MEAEYTLKPGMKGIAEERVSPKNTAASLGSGGLAVYATPAMVTLMERAAVNALGDSLGAEYSSVGTELNIKHLSATPEGMNVKAHAELMEIDGRRLVYHVEAHDEAGKIGEGRHERFIIMVKKFMEKTEGKKTQPR